MTRNHELLRSAILRLIERKRPIKWLCQPTQKWELSFDVCSLVVSGEAEDGIRVSAKGCDQVFIADAGLASAIRGAIKKEDDNQKRVMHDQLCLDAARTIEEALA